ncbi:MAG: pyridoxal-phosphate dependent enzyme [Nanoarchaeota archaeon]|nr:pyridoxal-phosphate dependent enzyme [Nanoarchaeota archaeon]
MAGIPLFIRYPALKEKLPYISLGSFPTPVSRLENLGIALGIENLYVKQDGLSGPYGGNKVRKLEFLLAKAMQDNAKAVMTFGFAGSNHAAATAVYAKRLGLDCISILLQQPNAQYVRDNLLVAKHFNAELHHFGNILNAILGSLYLRAKHKLEGKSVEIIPPGGSSPLGTIGYVNASFELCEQISLGAPRPDKIYVALGSMGTVAGIILGLKAAGLDSKVVAVDVAGKRFANSKKLKSLIDRTCCFLHSLDSTFPLVNISQDELCVRHEFMGEGYAHFTQAGMDAVRLMRETEGINLDGTYTGKTLSAIVNDAPSLEGKHILFWNTYNSMSISGIISGADYHSLPKAFYQYFENRVQQSEL